MGKVSVAILGAGLMGTAIAAAHLRCGVPVLLYDSAESALETAPNRIADELHLQDEPFDPTLLKCSGNINDVQHCGIFIETITEKLRAKIKLYRKINHDALLFTNTSTISITDLASPLAADSRRRFCGFHFFHPVRQRSLLEIIPGAETDSATVEAAKQHALLIEKHPIIVGDGPGFLVNRILNPYLTSALSLLAEGVDLQRIERIAQDFGMKMGPFRIMDEIGLDVVLHAGWVLFKAFPDRVPQSPLLLQLIEQGRLGRKTGRGFMLYPNSTSWDGNGEPDPLFVSEKTILSDEEIVKQLFLSMYDEAIRCSQDGIISDLADADLASIHALGFPEKTGGVVAWGNSVTITPVTTVPTVKEVTVAHPKCRGKP
jgi:3-hydroxyacyl-CoA dehydrogenase/enoyl-CoA hydratase/3-hydroxybutyryl-CoA epimerase/enoyl-CoA isomerase